MSIYVSSRKHSNFADITVIIGNVRIELGLTNKVELEEIISDLKEGLGDLEEIYATLN